jgi:hypothetical protein
MSDTKREEVLTKLKSLILIRSFCYKKKSLFVY